MLSSFLKRNGWSGKSSIRLIGITRTFSRLISSFCSLIYRSLFSLAFPALVSLLFADLYNVQTEGADGDGIADHSEHIKIHNLIIREIKQVGMCGTIFKIKRRKIKVMRVYINSFCADFKFRIYNAVSFKHLLCFIPQGFVRRKQEDPAGQKGGRRRLRADGRHEGSFRENQGNR